MATVQVERFSRMSRKQRPRDSLQISPQCGASDLQLFGGGTLIAAVFFYDHTDDIRGDLAERLAQVQVVQQVLFAGG